MIQGWTPDFVPAVLNPEVPDELVPVNQDVAKDTALALAANEGIFTGVSGGSTFGIAMTIAERAEPGAVICCMLPDTGERYLSSPLFEGIEEDMDEEERALSLSTPGFHMAAE